MSTLTIAVIADNDTEGLKYTLEGLVEQSVEDFKVLIVNNGCEEPAVKMIEEYCKEYVGFDSINTDRVSIPEARNIALEKLNADYYLFMDCCDYISPETVENVFAALEKNKADIIFPRYYFSGTGEPAYDTWADMLAVVPDIDKFDRALLNTLDFDGRIFSRKFFDRGLRFPDTPVLYNTQFISNCFFEHKAKAMGVAGAIYDRKNGVFFDDFAPGTEPGSETLEIYSSVYEGILSRVAEIIRHETGSLDGDEYTIQEILSVYFGMLISYFYRRFWYLSNDEITMLKDKFEDISKNMTKERQKKINEANADLHFPGMYMSREDAAKMPFFSLLLDFNSPTDVHDFIRTLYLSDFPFFEIFIRKSLEECIPERLRESPNIHVCEDKEFFATARADALGVPVNVKDSSPLDPRILSQLALSKAPRGMLQYIFSAKRKKYAAKTYLKSKGMQIS